MSIANKNKRIGEKQGIPSYVLGHTSEVDDEVTFGGSIYQSTNCFVNVNFATELAAGKWIILSGGGGGTVTSLTTTGTSGNSTLIGGVLNVPIYGAGGGGIYDGSGSLSGNTQVATGISSFRFDSTGQTGLFSVNGNTDKIGIGTASPTSRLHIIGETGVDERVLLASTSFNGTTTIARFQTTDGGFVAGQSLNLDFGQNATQVDARISQTYFGASQRGFRFFGSTGGTPDAIAMLTLRGGTNQYVGIGTETPTQKLEVAGNTRLNGLVGINAAPSNYQLEVTRDDGAATISNIANFNHSATSGVDIINNDTRNTHIRLNEAGVSNTILTSGGASYFGGTNATLSVGSSTTFGTFSVIKSAATNQNLTFVGINGGRACVTSVNPTNGMYFEVYDGSPKARLSSNSNSFVINNFGIGTVTPTQKLDVAGNALITGKLTIDATPDALQINHVNGRLTIGTTANDGGTHIWQRGTRGNLMSLGDASTQRLLVTSNGSTLISHTNASGNDFALRVDSLTVANLFRVDGDSNNIGIGTGAPSDSALVDMTSTTKGFLPPRLTTTQRDAIVTPSPGLIVYNTTTDKINFYTGAAWEAVSGGSFNGIYDGSGSLTTGTTITSGGYDLNITGTGKFGVSGDIQFLSTAALESDTIKIVQSTGTTGTTGGIITFDGQTGGLFAITDDKDGQLFGVADVSGNDIMYADADWLIKMGNPFQLSGSPFELKYDDVSGNTTLSTNAINVNLNVQNITSTGVTSNIDVTKSIIKISTTTSADLLTLPDGVEGQVISIIYVAETAGADDVTITPTNLLGYTTIFLTLIGTGCELYFTDGSWVVKSQNNVTLS